MDHESSFGCGQCFRDVIEAPPIEFTGLAEISAFIDSAAVRDRTPPRVIIIPEFIFFEKKVLSDLPFAKRVAAVIVYEGPAPGNRPSQAPFPFPPLSPRSVDDQEPNRFYNYYDGGIEQRERCDVTSDIQRNSDGNCLKFTFFPFNVFRVNASVAEMIRKRANRFPGDGKDADTSDAPTAAQVSAVAPRYNIQSVGRMFACAAKSSPSPDPSTGEGTASALQLDANSTKCLQDKTCLPIGGHSVWSALERIESPVSASPRRVLAITAPMDSIAFFPDLSLGAAAEISSLAAMMAVAEAVGKYRRSEVGQRKTVLRQPVYFAWNAQSWGYAGSARFLKDVAEFNCEKERNASKFESGCEKPYMSSLKFLDFRQSNFSVLNIGQIQRLNPRGNKPSEEDKSQFFKHTLRTTDSSTGEVDAALQAAFDLLAIQSSVLRLNASSGETLVPLDASQSFQRYMAGVDMSSITNYDTSFENQYYHTMYDNTTGDSERSPLYEATAAIASAVVDLCFDDRGVTIDIDKSIINSAITCFTGDWTNCALAKEYLGKAFDDKTGKIVPGNYPGSYFPITRQDDLNPSGAAKLALIRAFFAYHNRYEAFQDETKCERNGDCEAFAKKLNEEASPLSHSDLRTAYCARGVCVASDTYTHNAFGTALTSSNDIQSSFKYDENKLNINYNGSFPREGGWTESVWDSNLGICGAVRDTSLYGVLILMAGILLFLVSLGTTIWFDRLMFKRPIQSSVDVTPTPFAHEQ